MKKLLVLGFLPKEGRQARLLLLASAALLRRRGRTPRCTTGRLAGCSDLLTSGKLVSGGQFECGARSRGAIWRTSGRRGDTCRLARVY